MPEQYNETRKAGITRTRSFPLPNGKTIELGQLGLADYTQIESEVLKRHKRQYIETYVENADLLGMDKAEIVKEAVANASQFKIEDLPEKDVDIPMRDKETGRLMINKGEFVMQRQRAPYSLWWMSQTVEGRMTSVWLSMRSVNRHITYDNAVDLLTEAMQIGGEEVLEQAAQAVGELSESKIGNELGN